MSTLFLGSKFGLETLATYVKNAFLNGELEEEVHTEVPLGFDKARIHGNVCKFRKSLYGLKQSP